MPPQHHQPSIRNTWRIWLDSIGLRLQHGITKAKQTCTRSVCVIHTFVSCVYKCPGCLPNDSHVSLLPHTSVSTLHASITTSLPHFKMNTVPPVYSDPEWRWPFRKFGLRHRDLFTTLHDRFNTQTLPLQDLPAFHSDVCELVLECDTLEEFYSALEKRKEKRIRQLRTAWSDIAHIISSRPAIMACKVCYEDNFEDTERPPGSLNHTRIERWWSFIQYARTPSFDNIVAFFDGYVRDERKNPRAKWTGRRRRPAIEGNPSTATPGPAEAAEEDNKPESSRKASPEASAASTSSRAPSDSRPTSSSGRHHEAREGLMQAYKQIDRLCEFIEVEAVVSNDAKDLFRLMDKYKIMEDNSQEAAIDGCIFLACRTHRVFHTDRLIFDSLNADRKKVRKVVKEFYDFQQRSPHAEGEDATQKPVQTTEDAAARKRTNEEDAQESQQKKQQEMSDSAGDGDAGNPESMSSSKASPGAPISSTGHHHEPQGSLTKAYKMIKDLCEFANVEATVADDAKDLFRLMDKYKMMNGNSEDAVFYGCIFLACRKHNVPRTFNEIFYCLTANKTEVRKVVKQFQDFLHKFPHVEGDDATQKPVQTTARESTNEEDAQGSRRSWRQVMSEIVWVSDMGEHGPTSPNKRIDELCEMIHAGENVSNKAKNIFRYVDEHKILKGYHQEDIIGACIFTACRIHKVSPKLQEIFDSTNLNRSEVMTAARHLDQPRFPFMQGESAGDNDAQEHDKPELSRKASPGAPSDKSQPISSTGQLQEAYKEIDALCETINAGVNSSKKAKSFFKLIDKHKFTRGKPRETIIAICVFVGCRQNHVRVKLEEVLRHTATSKEEGARVFEQLENFMKIIRPPKTKSAPEIPVETTGARRRTNEEDAQGSQQEKRREMSDSVAESHADDLKPEPSRKASRGTPGDRSQAKSPSEQHHKAYKEIDALCEKIHVGDNVSNEAKNILRRLSKHEILDGVSEEDALGACILAACRRHEVTQKFREGFYSISASANREEVIRVSHLIGHFLIRFPFAQGESDGDGDAGRVAASRDKSTAAEAVPTSKRAEKRKRPDDSEDEARDKRPRTDHGSVPDRFQVPDSPIRDRFDGHVYTYASSTDPWSSSSSSRGSSPGGLSPIAVPHYDASDMANWPWPRKKTQMPGPSASGLASSVSGHSPPNQHPGAVDAGQALPRGDAEQAPAKDTSADAVDSKRSKGKPRANHRQRVDKRRSRREQETSSPQKQPLQRSRQERKASPSVDQVVRSRRSSRRDARQKLLFLGEDGTPCVADYEGKTQVPR